jgi:hypothetical protein
VRSRGPRLAEATQDQVIVLAPVWAVLVVTWIEHANEEALERVHLVGCCFQTERLLKGEATSPGVLGNPGLDVERLANVDNVVAVDQHVDAGNLCPRAALQWETGLNSAKMTKDGRW